MSHEFLEIFNWQGDEKRSTEILGYHQPEGFSPVRMTHSFEVGSSQLVAHAAGPTKPGEDANQGLEGLDLHIVSTAFRGVAHLIPGRHRVFRTV